MPKLLPVAALVMRHRHFIVVPRPLHRGAAHIASQLPDRGAQATSPGAATLPQQEKKNSADVQRDRASIIGFTCKEVR
jgi:hypothetical protein